LASTITNYSNSINVNFPVPGEDNDSQGFRNNFSKIQSALTVASKEITNIQNGAVNLNTTNDFGENIVKRATFQATSLISVDNGSVSGVVEVDFQTGSYQKYAVNVNTHTFTVVNWPSDNKCGVVTLEITPNTSSQININLGGITTLLSRTSFPVSYTQTTPILWQLWSYDNGDTVFAAELVNHAINTDGNGNVYTKAGSTSMTDGFIRIPAAAGAPIGVPTAIAGTVPLYYDTTNNRFYVYNGSWKQGSLS